MDWNGVATSSKLSGTAVHIPRGALRVSIEGSDWEARVLGRFEAAIASALQDKVPPLVEAQLKTLVALNGTAALQRRPPSAPLNRPHLPHLRTSLCTSEQRTSELPQRDAIPYMSSLRPYAPPAPPAPLNLPHLPHPSHLRTYTPHLCNHTQSRLRPYASQPATLCTAGSTRRSRR